MQSQKLLHTGRNCEQHADGSISTSLYNFVDAQKAEPIKGKLNAKLGSVGATALRSVNGSLQHISSERPDVYGKISVRQKNTNYIDNQTWQAVATANSI